MKGKGSSSNLGKISMSTAACSAPEEGSTRMWSLSSTVRGTSGSGCILHSALLCAITSRGGSVVNARRVQVITCQPSSALTVACYMMTHMPFVNAAALACA